MTEYQTTVRDFELNLDTNGCPKESIRQNIFLCKEVSNEIQEYVYPEYWGVKNRELYHLLDYKNKCISMSPT